MSFAPVYNEHSRALILGTWPSPKSREMAFYYGHPQNRFSPLLAALTGPDDGVVVSGPAPAGGVPSTIVEPLAGTDLRVLRLGAVSLVALKAAGFTPHLA